MNAYHGDSCPVCQSEFTEQDDIVVCPVCGAPHHRACYAKLGACAYQEKHASGHSYETFSGKKENEDADNNFDGQEKDLICPRCGCENPPFTLFCRICGTGLSKSTTNQSNQNQRANANTEYQQYSPNFGFGDYFHTMDFDPKLEYKGVNMQELSLFVGQNTPYFIPKFQALAKKELGLSFNFPSFLATFFYFFYRKMYLVGTLLMVWSVAVISPLAIFVSRFADLVFAGAPAQDIALLMSESDKNLFAIYTILSFINVFISFLVGLFSNRIYFHHAVHKISKIKKQYGENKTLIDIAITRSGNVNPALIGISLIILLALYFILTFILAF